MGALCKCMFIIETIVNIEHEDWTCFKGHICFSKNLFMFPLLLFLCTELFNYTNLFTFLHDRAALLLNMLNVHLLFIIRFVSLFVPTY